VAAVIWVAPALVLARYGVLALASNFLVWRVLISFAVTLELGRWYGGASIFALVAMVAVLAYAFRTALGDGPAFGGATLAE
jgi:hypothetical protein